MNTTSLYISTCRYVIQANPHDPESWADLYRYLPYLRQALSCCVCGGILHNPMGPRDSICLHHVCSECVGGKMRLKPSCSWCKEYENFKENSQLKIIVQCFKKLCEYIASSAITVSLSNTNNGSTNALMTIIQEGSTIKETLASGPPLQLPPILQKQVKDSSAASNHIPSGSDTCGVQTGSEKVSTTAATGNGLDNVIVVAKPDNSGASPVAVALTPGASSSNCQPSHNESIAHHHSLSPLRPRSPKGAQRKHTGEILSEPGGKKHRRGNESPGSSDGVLFISDNKIISEAVAAEHDYNRGPPSDGESVKHRTRQKSGEHDKQSKKVKVETLDQKQSLLHNVKGKQKSSTKGHKGKGHGCRCGLATQNPGKLTCCGQRCPCYSAFKGCVDCRCRGCRNPRGDPIHPSLIATHGHGLTPVSLQVTQIRQEDSENDTDVDIDV